MDILNGFGLLALTAVVVIFIFFGLRQVVLWYLRLNQMADNIAYIADHYRSLDQAAGRIQQPPPPPTGRFAPKGIQPSRTP